jgi:tRNA 2-thiouridine synthesizing protein A
MPSEVVTITLDATGMLCPLPVLRARRILDDMNNGDILKITATDPASVRDIPAFCQMSRHTLVMAEANGNTFVFKIQKWSNESPNNEANDNIP